MISCASPAALKLSGAAAGSAAPVDESRTVTLAGNVHPLARAQFDRGAAESNLALKQMVLVLQSSPEQQSELDALTTAQQDPHSPQYRQWLTPAEFGARFGASDAQLAQVTAWLASHGFAIDEVSAGRRTILFSGTAGEISSALHTAIHSYRVDGATYIANAEDPQIPSELAGLVAGVVSLNDFRHISQVVSMRPMTSRAQYSAGATHYIFPADFAAIYDLNPLFSAGTKGAGATIAIAGRSQINLSDVASFRATTGLAANPPTVIVDGTDPGLVAGDQSESTLDVEWSGAVAPEAQIDLVVAASTATTDGIDLAAQYIVNHAIAPVLSVSYASCEQEMGAAELKFYHDLWEQAASEGISVFVASGDAGAAGCQSGNSTTGTEAAVNGMCISPYATCVGGTEFNEGTQAASYWSSVNSSTYGSALGYIPEEVWNESALDGGSGLWASGGGASTVYAEPSWQQGQSGADAAGGMRAVPDVSLAAADHDGSFLVEGGSHWIISGTSVTAPEFAGLMALVVGKNGGTGQGNANPRLYALASSANGAFHATPSGNNTVPGVTGFTAEGASYNLGTGLGSVDGALLVNDWSASASDQNGQGGLATLAVTAAAQSATVVAGGATTLQFAIVPGGAFTGNVTLSLSGLPSGVTATWSANPIVLGAGASTTSVSLTLLAAAGVAARSSSVVVAASGDGLTAAAPLTLTVAKQGSGCGSFGLMPVSCKPQPRWPSF